MCVSVCVRVNPKHSTKSWSKRCNYILINQLKPIYNYVYIYIDSDCFEPQHICLTVIVARTLAPHHTCEVLVE